MLGGLLLLLAFGVITLQRRTKQTISAPKPAPTAVLLGASTNALSTAPTNATASVSTNQPGSLVGPGVAELLRLMQEWRQAHPTYRVHVEMTGPDLEGTLEVFRFLNEKGIVANRIKTELRQPVPLSFIVEEEQGRARAYFPSENQVVDMDPQQEATRFLAQVGWIAGGLDVAAPIKLSRASFVEVGPDYRALTMVFPGALFQMPRAAGDLFLTIKLDEAGKALSLEQLTLGGRVVSTMKYLSENAIEIRQEAPKIPETAVASKRPFQEALQEAAKWNKNQPGKPTSI